ncbi:hypothetical protein DMH12_26270 [Streptomyces sp. WAC 04229]|nr:hypothetical protein DMH12_26270 [Streptomyces sp. WAC 04229]
MDFDSVLAMAYLLRLPRPDVLPAAAFFFPADAFFAGAFFAGAFFAGAVLVADFFAGLFLARLRRGGAASAASCSTSWSSRPSCDSSSSSSPSGWPRRASVRSCNEVASAPRRRSAVADSAMRAESISSPRT